MQEWWDGLGAATRVFYGMAAFFSVFFVWQIIAAFLGLGGDEVDAGGLDAGDVDAPDEVGHPDAVESSQAFKILSFRSIIIFFTLFSWGSALYTTEGMPVLRAMGISSIWGVCGMLLIASVIYALGRLGEEGTKNMASCKGALGTVYLDIPAGGFGEIKTTVGDVVEHVKAQSVNGEALSAGTPVRVVQVVGQAWVKVEKHEVKGDGECRD